MKRILVVTSLVAAAFGGLSTTASAEDCLTVGDDDIVCLPIPNKVCADPGELPRICFG